MKKIAASRVVRLLVSQNRRGEAVEYAQAHNDETNDLLLDCTEGDEWLAIQQHQLYGALHRILRVLERRENHLPSLEAIRDIVRAVIRDGNYLAFHNKLRWTCGDLARLYAEGGDHARAVEALRQEADSMLGDHFSENPEDRVPYTGSLLDHVTETWFSAEPPYDVQIMRRHIRQGILRYEDALGYREDYRALLAEYPEEEKG